MKRFFLMTCLVSVVLTHAQRACAAEPFTLVAGDRVVFVGNTLIEREQRHCYWETMLTRRFPDKNVSFRNLGWSGDTVFGDARASFGTPADGFKHLKDLVFELKPAVIFVGYGGNEAFAGEAGLPRFREGLDKLLDTLAKTKARIVLLAPLRQEDLGRPLPDPAQHNRDLRLYRDVLQQAAGRRGYSFVDLYDLIGDGDKAAPLTDNGIHLTPFGYWRVAVDLEKGLGLKPARWLIDLDRDGKTREVLGAELKMVQAAPVRFTVIDAELPAPAPPAGTGWKPVLPGSPGILPEAGRTLRVRGLEPGTYALHIDGKPIARATAAEWSAGVSLTRGPELDQAEQLRQAIVDKNQLFFHRWRPHNETYLFGFRNYEQGKNAVEMPRFDALVAEKEKAIASLRVPAAHRYELIIERGESK